MRRNFLFALALIATACSRPVNPDVAALPGLTKEQRISLSAWLDANPTFRPARDSDCNCEEQLQDFRREGFKGHDMRNYKPYLQVGDFNRDGQSDIAILMFNSSRDPKALNRLLIFNGPFSNRPRAPAAAFPAGPPKDANIVYAPGPEPVLGVGPFESEYCELLPKRQTYSANCDEGP